MLHLELQTAQFKYLESAFTQWLKNKGYSPTTIKTFPVHLREYLHFLESKKIQNINEVKREDGKRYVQYLEERTNKRYGGGLSSYAINKQVVAINTFHKYLMQVKELNLPSIPIPQTKFKDEKQYTILSFDEIKRLYEATYHHGRENPKAMGQRDRALISLFYGAGLRKKEVTNLNLDDIDEHKGEVLVREGKNKKGRLVPLIGRAYDDLIDYLHEGRYWFACSHKQRIWKDRKLELGDQKPFILNQKGGRLSHGFYPRLRRLKELAGLHKNLAPHVLRHTIGTHLLAKGLPMERIAEFLGHSSLESTQIYTHILEEYKHEL